MASSSLSEISALLSALRSATAEDRKNSVVARKAQLKKAYNLKAVAASAATCAHYARRKEEERRVLQKALQTILECESSLESAVIDSLAALGHEEEGVQKEYKELAAACERAKSKTDGVAAAATKQLAEMSQQRVAIELANLEADFESIVDVRKKHVQEVIKTVDGVLEFLAANSEGSVGEQDDAVDGYDE